MGLKSDLALLKFSMPICEEKTIQMGCTIDKMCSVSKIMHVSVFSLRYTLLCETHNGIQI